MRSFSERLRFITLYYLIIYTYIYLSSYIVYRYTPNIMDDFIYALIFVSATVLTLSLIAYTVYREFRGKSFVHYLGLGKKGFIESLVLSSASFALPNLLMAIIAYHVFGINPFTRLLSMSLKCSVPPWFNHINPSLLPIAAILFWILSGVASTVFLLVFPLQALSYSLKKLSVPLVSVLFILIYNQPILTGEWRPDDILFLGIIFPLISYRYGNSIGLILSYVFLYEMPIRAAFLRGWGEPGFHAFVLIQLVWGVTSIVAAFIMLLKSIKEKHRGKPLLTLQS